MIMEEKTNKNKALKMAVGIIVALAMLVGLYFGVRAIIKASEKPEQPSEPSQGSESVNPTDKPVNPTDSGSQSDPTGETQPLSPEDLEIEASKTKKVYTEEDVSTDDPRLDEIVASCAGRTINSRDAQVFFAMQYYGFMNDYGDWAMYFGLDASQPLSDQLSTVSDITWEQYFLMSGISDFHQYAALAAKAASEGYQMLEGEEEQLSQVRDGLKERFAAFGYDTADAYVQSNFGVSVRYEDYVRYLELYFYAMSYENHLYQELSFTDDELNAFYEQNPSLFTGIKKDQTNINVRHILIQPEVADGASEAEAAAAKEAARAKAEELLNTYRQNPTEDNFAQLAKDNSTDPGSASNGGLYEEVYPGQMVESFNDWCFDPARQPGDTDIVETDYGFHIMYFVSKSDTLYWKSVAEDELHQDRMIDLLDELNLEYPITWAYEKLILCPLPKQ